MKKINFLFIAAAILSLLSSCKKDDTNLPGAATGKSMGFLTESAVGAGGTTVKNRYVLLDIDHADNARKKFMTVDIVENSGSYKFQMVEGPKPITAYATNFPAEVRRIVSGQGYGHDFLVSAYMKMRTISGVTRPYTFNYDSIQKFVPTSSVIIPINEMHNGIYAGTMMGKEPQARVEFWAPGKPDPGPTPPDANDTLPDYFFYAQYYRVARPARLYFYFNEGNGFYTSVAGPTARANRFEETAFRPLADLAGKADAAISYEGNTSVLFFFDFDRWEFMTIKFPCAAAYGAGCTTDIEYSPVKSMNTLMEWPADWRK
ncbi:MAG: hypothetical protein H7Y86_21530 [Rhizobacter sp.]|nr:hypothetical protein [Ferruginibacter sp.]